MSWLTNHQLENAVSRFADTKTKDAFLGVFAIDKLPSNIVKYPILLIVNTQTSNLDGEHWFAIYISSHRRGEIFDSVLVPIDLRIRRWMNYFANSWRRNDRAYQSLLSPICGAYVLYFILNRMNYETMNQLLCPKELKSCINDSFIREWYRTLSMRKYKR